MKRIKEIILFFLIGGAIIYMSGCLNNDGPTKGEITNEILKQKYNEEFNIFSIQERGDIWVVECSPVDNPRVVFKAKCDVTNNAIVTDNYEETYLSELINEELKKELVVFFPNAYIHTEVHYRPKEELTDLKNKTLEDLMKNVERDNATYSMDLDIYFDKEIGTSKLYKEEYDFFKKIAEENVNQKIKFPLTVSIMKVDSDTLNRISDYYLKNVGELESYFETNILMVDEYKLGIVTYESVDLGNPANIAACFKKDKPSYIKDVDEYIRRRELLENE